MLPTAIVKIDASVVVFEKVCVYRLRSEMKFVKERSSVTKKVCKRTFGFVGYADIQSAVFKIFVTAITLLKVTA